MRGKGWLLGTLLLATACSSRGSSNGVAGSLGSTSSGTTSNQGAQAPLEVTAVVEDRLSVVLGQPVDPASLEGNVAAFEDEDEDQGGTFAPFAGRAELDGAGTTLRFVPLRAPREGHEVRLVLGGGLRSTAGAHLRRGSLSEAISFPDAAAGAVFEARFRDQDPPTPDEPASLPDALVLDSTLDASAPTVLAQSAGPDPSTFAARPGTDVWHIDFTSRPKNVVKDLAKHGLRSGDAATDRLARARWIVQTLGHASKKYLRTAKGEAVPGKSFKISLVAAKPTGSPGVDYSREVVGGLDPDSPRTLGRSYYDPGNDQKEDNAKLGYLGIFTRQIYGTRSKLSPALTSRDKKFLDGSYKKGSSSSGDARLAAVRRAIDDFAHATASVIAHEVGHSVGLNHFKNDPIMRPVTNPTLLSNRKTAFGAEPRRVLTKTLGRD